MWHHKDSSDKAEQGTQVWLLKLLMEAGDHRYIFTANYFLENSPNGKVRRYAKNFKEKSVHNTSVYEPLSLETYTQEKSNKIFLHTLEDHYSLSLSGHSTELLKRPELYSDSIYWNQLANKLWKNRDIQTKYSENAFGLFCKATVNAKRFEYWKLFEDIQNQSQSKGKVKYAKKCLKQMDRVNDYYIPT